MWSLPKYLVVFLLIFLSGCYTQKKAQKQIGKADYTYPELTAAFCKDSYPCVIIDSVTRIDTLTDFIEIELPGTVDTVRRNDTVILRTNTVQAKYIQKVNTVTKVDSGAIKLLNIQLSNARQSEEKYRGKAEDKSDWVKWLLILCGLLLAGNIVQLKLK